MLDDFSLTAWLRFFDTAEEQGLMNRGRARALRTGVQQILTDLPDGQQRDVRTIDFEAAFKRYLNKNPGRLIPKSMADYRRRLDHALREFTEYNSNPTAYQSGGRASRASASGNGARAKKRDDGAQEKRPVPAVPIPKQSGLALDFPLRPEYRAQVVIPADMTTEEARRLGAFLLTLAADFRPQAGGA